MKRYLTSNLFERIAIFLIVISSTVPLHAQLEFECLMESSDPLATMLSSFDGIDFYQEESCDPLYLRCNFVFLRKNDGTGSFPTNDPKIQDIIDGMNNWWSSIPDPADCSTLSYPFDSKVRVKVEVHYINNSDAYDWYSQAVSLGSSYSTGGTSFCPDNLEGDPNLFPALMEVVDDFNAEHQDAINFYFVENAVQLDYLEDAIDCNTCEVPWDDPHNIKIFSGCSKFAHSYNSNESQWILMVNQWTGYYTRINFGTVYYPEYASVGNEILAGWHLDGIYRLANHELGHTIMSQGHTCNCLNLMIGQGCTPGWHPEANYLTQSQLNRLQSTLMTSNIHKAIICDELSEENCDILVTEDATISNPISVFGDIMVKSGVTLKITSTVYLSHDSRIDLAEDAKLIVDGGTLTSGCDDTWIGIKVTGGNSDFDVKFTNEAKIENTSSAAVSMFAPFPWPEIQSYGNGILQADHTTFNNTRRIVEMMAWTPSFNPSYIRDCVQNGGKWSITNWNCFGVEITDNIFNDIGESSIVTETGQFYIQGNKFNSTKNDILFANVSPGFGSIINKNEFNGLHTGIRALGTTIAQNRITKNNFEAGIFDIFMDGDNNYWIESNDLSANFGLASLNTGNHSNEVLTNDIDGNIIGLAVVGVNKGYNFYKNCFNTSNMDSYISGQITPVVTAGIYNPANNCFTHMGNSSSSVYDITGSPSPFKYVEPNDQTATCHDAIKAHANVARVYQGSSADVCSGAGSDFPLADYDDCNLSLDEGELVDAISSLTSAILAVRNNSSLTSQAKEWYIMSYNRCLKRANWNLFQVNLMDADYADARNILASDTTEDAKIAIYTSYIYENEHANAGNYLSSLVSISSALKDFKWIQNLNLDRISYGPFYEVDGLKLDTVEIIANKTHKYAGYAKALYYHLTGEIITSELPYVLEDYLEPRSPQSNEGLQEVNITPNPFSDLLLISTIGFQNNLNVRVVDQYGRILFQDRMGSDMTIATSSWSSGLYIVIVYSEDEIIESKKVMLID